MRAVRPGDRSREPRTTTGRASITASRGAPRPSHGSVDSPFDTGTRGLTNARTRIVGNRTGFLADAIIALVRFVAASRAPSPVEPRTSPQRSSRRSAGRWSVLVPLALVARLPVRLVELVVIGFAGAVLIVIAIIYLVGRNAIVVTLTIPHSRVVVGERRDRHLEVRTPRAAARSA